MGSQMPDTQSELWEILEILEETKDQYLVAWAGNDPDGKPWEPGWTDKPLKHAPEILAAWEAKKAKAKAKAKKTAARKKGKKRDSTEDDSAAKKSLKRKRSGGSARRDTSETSRRTRSVSTNLPNKPSLAGSSPADGDSARIVKRRRHGSAIALSITTSSNRTPEGREHESEEIVPETQPPLPANDENAFQDGEYESLRPSSSKSRSQSIDKNVPPHQKAFDLQNPIKRRTSAVGPRKSNLSASKTVLRKGPPKPQRPLPFVSPSVFRPYLPTQDPIEDFSSPEKPRRKRNFSETIEESTPSIPQDDNSLLLLQQMEEEYIQFTDDASPHVSSPVKSHTGRNNQVEASEQTAQVVSLAGTIAVRPVQLFDPITLPSTASTQLADIDSQSQVVFVPDSQPEESQDDEESLEKLRSKGEVASLRDQISRLEDDLEGALLQNGEADMQILHLKGELEACRKAQASLVSKDKFVEQAEALSSAQQQIKELQEVVLNVRDSARRSWDKISEEHAQKLQAEVRRWKGMYEVQVKRNQKTDDVVRRKAAEHPELAARISDLEGQLRSRNDDYVRTITERQEQNAVLKQTINELEKQWDAQREQLVQARSAQSDLEVLQQKYDALDSEACHLRTELTFLTGIKTRLDDLLASHDENNEYLTQTQSPDLYVCRYVSYGEPCHGLFVSPADAQCHALRCHYGLTDENIDS